MKASDLGSGSTHSCPQPRNRSAEASDQLGSGSSHSSSVIQGLSARVKKRIKEIEQRKSKAKVKDPNRSSASSANTSASTSSNENTNVITSSNQSVDVSDVTNTGSAPPPLKSSSLHNRSLLEVARDKKRILEICYATPKSKKSPLVSGKVKEALASTIKPLLTDDEKAETPKPNPVKKPKSKRKNRKEKKKGKKKKKAAKMGETREPKPIEIITETPSDPNNSTVDLLNDPNGKSKPTLSQDAIDPKSNIDKGKNPKAINGQFTSYKAKLSGTPKPLKKRKIKLVRRDARGRDASGKVVRRRRKGKGRDRVVKPGCFKKGKHAKIGLSTIDESFYDDLSDSDIDSSDMDSYDRSYESNFNSDDEFALSSDDDDDEFGSLSSDGSSDINSSDDYFTSSDEDDDESSEAPHSDGNAANSSILSLQTKTREVGIGVEDRTINTGDGKTVIKNCGIQPMIEAIEVKLMMAIEPSSTEDQRSEDIETSLAMANEESSTADQRPEVIETSLAMSNEASSAADQRSEGIETSLVMANETSSTVEQRPDPVPDIISDRVPSTTFTTSSHESVTISTEVTIVDTVPSTDDNTDTRDRQPSLQSISSVDSTACTSTASPEITRDKISGLCSCCRCGRGSCWNMICAGFSFVVFVAAATLLVLYFLFYREEGLDIFKNNPTAPTMSPTSAPVSGQRPSLRPSVPPPYIDITETSPNAPTLAPTSIVNTLSTSCYRPEDTPDAVTIEAEYAMFQFGDIAISNTNAGYCGEGYISDLTTDMAKSESGFGFLAQVGSGFGFQLIVNTTGYYKVALRYNNVDRSEKSLLLQIDDRDKGTFDLVSTGNKTSWMIDGIDNILLRKGNHSIYVSAKSDERMGPNVDWLALTLQEPLLRFDYLTGLVAQASGMSAIYTVTQTRTLQWMSTDSIDWSNLTDQELIERYALVHIYNSVGGDDWTNNNQWLSENHACGWYGVTCSKDMLVTDLMLGNNGLIGYLPTDLSLLTNLFLISLENNDLQGTIPSQISKLRNLSKLLLHANFLSGDLPSELGALKELTTIDVRANFLYGEIPKEVYSMVRLRMLALGSNFLSGTLSTSVGELTALEDLDLQIGKLSGTIPTELGELTRLTNLALGLNQLSGTIPWELGLLESLDVLDINSNLLTGFLPLSLSLLADTAIDYYGNDIVE